MRKIFYFIAIIASLAMLYSCEELLQEDPPTKSKMEGIWKVSKATDVTTGEDITNRINFPITGFQLNSDGTVISTASPFTMYVVYGMSKFVNIAGKIDQVFNYANLDFSGGEFFIGGGVRDRFTLEMKLEGLPGQKAITTLLEILGIGNDYLDVVVYHKFMNVKIGFSEDYSIMYWEFDDMTKAIYNTKDNYGNYVLWGGWPVDKFSRVQVQLQRQGRSLTEIVKEAAR